MLNTFRNTLLIFNSSRNKKMDKNFSNLVADNLCLRQIVPTDINNIYLGLSHPEIIKYYGVSYDSLSATQSQMRWYKALEENRTGIWWAIVDLKQNIFYGAIGFNNISTIHQKAEIGFWLLPAYWGKGIMKNALQLACTYGFNELKLHRIEALVETANSNSKKLLEKLSFAHEGTLVDYEIKNNNFISLDSYAKFH